MHRRFLSLQQYILLEVGYLIHALDIPVGFLCTFTLFYIGACVVAAMRTLFEWEVGGCFCV